MASCRWITTLEKPVRDKVAAHGRDLESQNLLQPHLLRFASTSSLAWLQCLSPSPGCLTGSVSAFVCVSVGSTSLSSLKSSPCLLSNIAALCCCRYFVGDGVRLSDYDLRKGVFGQQVYGPPGAWCWAEHQSPLFFLARWKSSQPARPQPHVDGIREGQGASF